MNKCVVCGVQNNNKAIFREDGIDILRCLNCGHVYSSCDAPEDGAGYFGADIGLQDHFWWREAHERMYRDFGRRFLTGRSGRLLDVGCGLGYFVKFVTERPGWKAYGSEISVPAADFARKELGLANIIAGEVQSAGFEKKSFDIITLWDVIEHVPDPHPLLKFLNSILKDDGVLFMHTPNIKIQLPKARIKKWLRGETPGAHYLEAKDHVNIYSAGTLSAILTANGYKDIKFIHLHPIQSISGSRSGFLRVIKNGWFYAAKLIGFFTGNRVNMDNLFVAARKF
ncbi:MAG: class I SAM-dependent methyltransferase [Candidatus Falkowbacteria bacterium]